MSQHFAIESSVPLSPRWQPAKMSWWYHSIIDFMMAHPQATKKEMADYFKCSEMAIYLITSSNIFQAHFAARRKEFSEKLDASIHQKLANIADKSLGLIADVLEKKRDTIPLDRLVELQESVLDRLGYGPSKPSGAPVVVQVNTQASVEVPVTAEDIAAARQALRRAEALTAREVPLIEHESKHESIEPLGAVVSPESRSEVEVVDLPLFPALDGPGD